MTTDSRVESAAQFLSSFQKAGYGHVLVMMEFEPSCSRLATAFQKLGCGWCTPPAFRDKYLSSIFPFNSQYPKLFLGARIIRMGYNVMITDSGEVALLLTICGIHQSHLAVSIWSVVVYATQKEVGLTSRNVDVKLNWLVVVYFFSVYRQTGPLTVAIECHKINLSGGCAQHESTLITMSKKCKWLLL